MKSRTYDNPDVYETIVSRREKFPFNNFVMRVHADKVFNQQISLDFRLLTLYTPIENSENDVDQSMHGTFPEFEFLTLLIRRYIECYGKCYNTFFRRPCV